MENISLEFLLERKSIIKASKDKAKEEMASKGADRKAAAAEKASGNSDELSKWGKAIWDIISKLNHGAIVKDTFNQSAADGTLQAAAEKGLLDDKKGNQKNEGVTYEDFIMQESSLARLASKIKKGGLAHISAERADKSKKENKERSKQLRKDIRGAGLPGATKVEGQYKEAGQDEPSKEETSVVSSGKMSKKKFKKLLKKLAKKYDQDSVLIQKDKDTDAKLHATTKAGKKDLGKWDGKVGRMKPGGSGEMQTRIKGKTYTYE